MNFILETSDKKINLLFSNYFLSRVGKLSGKTLTETTIYLAGAGENGTIRGGMLDDLEARAIVIAAGIDAYNMSKGEMTQTSLIEGYQILEKVPNPLGNPVWAEMFVEVMKTIMPEKLGDKPTAKKKAVKKASR